MPNAGFREQLPTRAVARRAGCQSWSGAPPVLWGNIYQREHHSCCGSKVEIVGQVSRGLTASVRPSLSGPLRLGYGSIINRRARAGERRSCRQTAPILRVGFPSGTYHLCKRGTVADSDITPDAGRHPRCGALQLLWGIASKLERASGGKGALLMLARTCRHMRPCG